MLNRLNYIWRVIATGISFAVFGIGGALLSMLVIPMVALVTRDDALTKRRVRWLIHRSFRLFLNMMAGFGLFRFDLAEVERNKDRFAGKIVIANHPTLIDVVALIAVLPNADCVVKEKLWRNPFLRGVVKAADYIKNSEDVEKLLSHCRKSLDEGYCIIIFPEGTRTSPGQPIRLQRGASNIALRCNADLLSVIIRCEPTTLTKQEAWYSVPERKADFSMKMGQLIPVSQIKLSHASPSIQARKLTSRIKDYFTEELQHYA